MVADTYDVFDFIIQAEFAQWNLIVDELTSQERLTYDGPRQSEINTPLCLHLTVYTRS